jgi:hypothetical protein
MRGVMMKPDVNARGFEGNLVRLAIPRHRAAMLSRV